MLAGKDVISTETISVMKKNHDILLLLLYMPLAIPNDCGLDLI